MQRLQRLGLAVTLLSLAQFGSAGCAPIPLSDECVRMQSDCLKDCPDPIDRPQRTSDNDQRTNCEAHCHDLCD